MKKTLLLPLLLPLLTLSLIGCTKQKDGVPENEWVSLENNQTLVVFVENTIESFSLSTYNSVDFHVRYDSVTSYGQFVTEIQVKAKDIHTVNHIYKGFNVSYALYTTE